MTMNRLLNRHRPSPGYAFVKALTAIVILSVVIQGSFYLSSFSQTGRFDDSFLPPEKPEEHLKPSHVAFGLSGNNPGFFDEFEVALKSVLLNAPLDRNLSVHILADNDALTALNDLYNKTDLAKWVSRNQIQIQSYNVSSRLKDMESVIMHTWEPHFPEVKTLWQVSFHTMGTYFRLFAHWFLPATAEYVLYMDTDVTILANLGELWQMIEAKPDVLFHWGRGMCAGFLAMKVSRIDEIWALARKAPLAEIRKKGRNRGIDDQLIFIAVNETHPNEVNRLPDGYDLTHSLKWHSSNYPYHEVYPEAFMLHHNANGNSPLPYWNSSRIIQQHHDSWGLMEYYIHLPWTWARFFARSQL
ncbi:hypothetical protein HJC23_008207, partial [Cyclotella cryptica]